MSALIVQHLAGERLLVSDKHFPFRYGFSKEKASRPAADQWPVSNISITAA